MQTPSAALLQEVKSAIEQDQLILPSLPDVMLHLRTALQNPDVSYNQIARLLSADAALAARILKVANNAVYCRQQHIDNLPQAIARLGCKLVNTLVTNYTIMRLFAQPGKPYRKLLHAIQAHSIATAKLSFAIAHEYTSLAVEDALLAGLLHNIGCLPLLQTLQTGTHADKDEIFASQLLEQHHPRVGSILLQKWHFPETLVAVAAEHNNLKRMIRGAPDLVDIVMVANLRIHHPEGVPQELCPGASVFTRLKMAPDSDLSSLLPHLTHATELLLD